MKRIVALLSVCSLSVLLSACGSSGGGGAAAPTPAAFTKLLGSAASVQSGNASVIGNAIAVDGTGNVIIAGQAFGKFSSASGRETRDANGSGDIFVAKFDSTGKQLWVNRYGDPTLGNDARGVAVDSNGDIYVAGSTLGSIDGVTTNTGGNDAVVFKVSGVDGALGWVDQADFSSTGNDYALAIAIDSSNNIYVTGNTEGSPGATTNAGLNDAFVATLTTSGVFGEVELIGGTGDDYGYAITVDGSDNVYMAGDTTSTLFAGTGSGLEGDIFVAKLNPAALETPLWSRQEGTDNLDHASGIAVDASGRVFVTGATTGNLGGTNSGTVDVTSDYFVLRYPALTSGVQAAPDHSVQKGTGQTSGGPGENAYGITLDNSGNVYVVGVTNGLLQAGVPFTGAGGDIFVAKYDSILTAPATWIRQLGTTSSDSAFAAVDKSGNVYVTGSTAGDLAGLVSPDTYHNNSSAFLLSFTDAGVLR